MTTPKQLMIWGALYGVVLSFIAIFLTDVPTITVAIFGAGALFGKGYGLWEERTDRETKP